MLCSAFDGKNTEYCATSPLLLRGRTKGIKDMEFVIVTYPSKRSVYVDGELTGYTNQILRIDAGTHRFTLGPPVDWSPVFCELAVTATTVLFPMQVVFINKG
jgi:hypothetical protein